MSMYSLKIYDFHLKNVWNVNYLPRFRPGRWWPRPIIRRQWDNHTVGAGWGMETRGLSRAGGTGGDEETQGGWFLQAGSSKNVAGIYYTYVAQI